MWDKMPWQLKDIIIMTVIVISLFSTLYLGAWYWNGMYATHFDLSALITLLKSISDFLGLIIAKFGIDSLLNTEIPWLNKIGGKKG